jgi:hypothetical protein
MDHNYFRMLLHDLDRFVLLNVQPGVSHDGLRPEHHAIYCWYRTGGILSWIWHRSFGDRKFERRVWEDAAVRRLRRRVRYNTYDGGIVSFARTSRLVTYRR